MSYHILILMDMLQHRANPVNRDLTCYLRYYLLHDNVTDILQDMLKTLFNAKSKASSAFTIFYIRWYLIFAHICFVSLLICSPQKFESVLDQTGWKSFFWNAHSLFLGNTRNISFVEVIWSRQSQIIPG